MSISPHPAGQGEYLRHRGAVFAVLAGRYRSLDADSRQEIYNEVWASVLDKRSRGQRIENLEAYLVGAADKLASKRVFGADARRRISFDPQQGPFTAVADGACSPEEHVVSADESRRVRLLIDELQGPERAVLKLKLDLGLEPAEIRERLGLTERQYRRVTERAGRALAAQFKAFDSEGWERRQRSLLVACLLGVASPRQQAKARRLVESDPSARALLGELRRLGEGAAATLPVPPAVGVAGVESPLERLGELAASARQQGGELFSGAKNQAAAAVTRTSDPTPFAGVRPGAVTAVVAGCLAAGGGAYCAIEGIPDPLPRLFQERPKPTAEAKPGAKPIEAPRELGVDPPTVPARTPQVPASKPPADPAPAVVPASPPPPPPETEFEPGGSSLSASSASRQGPPPSSGGGPAPAGSQGGEFAP